MIVIRSEKEIKNQLIATIRDHPEGLTIHDLAQLLGFHRQTITKYILFLDGAGIVYRRRIGAVTLHYLRAQFDRMVKRRDA